MNPVTMFKIAFVVTIAGVFAVGVVTGVRVDESKPAAAEGESGAVIVPNGVVTETATVTVTLPPINKPPVTATVPVPVPGATVVQTALLPVPGATLTVPAPRPSTSPTTPPAGTLTPTPSTTASPTPTGTQTPKNHANGIDCFVLVEVDHGILIKVPCKE